MASVSIIIVGWNARESLLRCLASLMPCPYEVIVVDNCSSDGSADHVAASFPAVTLVRAPVNLGYAGAVNCASRRVEGEFLLLLSSEVAAHGGAIEQLASCMESHPACGAVAGCLDDQPDDARRFPTLVTLAAELLLFDRLRPGNRASGRSLALDVRGPTRRRRCDDGEVTDEPIEVEHPRTACLMLRRAAFEAVGRMDEAFYPAWFEDADLCRRLQTGGWQIVFQPSARFTRLQPGTARQMLGHETFTRIWYRNLQRYVRKHHGLAGIAVVKLLIVAGMALRIAASVFTGDRRARGTSRRVMVDVVRPTGYARLMDQLIGESQATDRQSLV